VKNYPGAGQTFGYVTKANREAIGLPKEHHVDASVIASRGLSITFVQDIVLLKRCVARGDYQRTKSVRSEKRIPAGKVHGFRKFDKVRYRGIACFVKGRMSTGYAILMNIDGNKQCFKPVPKFNKMERLEARKSCIVTMKTL
jgi:hypothetical protein